MRNGPKRWWGGLVVMVLCESAVPALGLLQPLTLNDDQSVPCTATPSATTPVPLSALAAALDQLPALVDSIRSKLGAPGAGLVVVQGGRVVNFTASGEASAGVPFTLDTIVRIASNTKLFTTLAAYRLRDQGKLSLDDPVSKWIPGFAVKTPYSSKRPLCLRSLATHTSGLVREVPACTDCATVQAAVVKTLAAEEHSILSPQFTETHYSNLGLALLGRAVAAAAEGAPQYEEYVEREILGVLGMTSSGFNYTDAVRARMAHGVDGEGNAVPLPAEEFEWAAPCGTMYSTCGDVSIVWVVASTQHGTQQGYLGFSIGGFESVFTKFPTCIGLPLLFTCPR
jgi:CubicO group peptidase (beta-lactamase class C family)